MPVIQTCALTSGQKKLWDDTRTALMWHCPAFTHIFYTLLHPEGAEQYAIFTKDIGGVEIPWAATDGSSIIINPDTFFKLNLNERIFVLAHEIMHCILNHLILAHGWARRAKVAYSDGTELPYDQKLMNVATDLVINDLLITSKVGAFNKSWLHDTNIATAQDSALDAYRKLFKKAKHIQVQGVGFDAHLAPGQSQGKDPGQAAQERNETRWKTEIAAAAQSARLQGRLPAGIERLLSEILEPQVDWREKIESLFARKVGSGTYNWRTADRRLIVRDIIAPGRSGFGAGTVVVAVDTSGSIGDKELAMFFAEMAGILEDVRPERLFVVWCDAKIHRVDEVDEPSDLAHVRKQGAPGGGGTSFIPRFEWMNEESIRPDALVYLTDGYGSFPHERPSYPVIWGNISKPGSIQYPFGDTVDIPVRAA